MNDQGLLGKFRFKAGSFNKGKQSMRKVFCLILLGLSSTALAGRPSDPPPGVSEPSSATGIGVGIGIAGSRSESSSVAASNSISNSASNANVATHVGVDAHGGAGGAGGHANQHQSQEQSQSQRATASNEGVHNSASYSSYYKERLQAPSSHAPAIYASHNCSIGKSAGLSGPGFSVNGGKAEVDPACDRREWARVLMAINPELALKVACSDPIVAAVADSDDCRYQAQEVQAVVHAGPDLSQYATKQELDRAFRKSQEK